MKFIIEMDSQETMDAIASGALNTLLKGADRRTVVENSSPVANVQEPAVSKQVPQPEAPAVPVQTSAEPVHTAQASTAVPVTPVSTTVREYALDDLASAAMTLMDKGMQPQLQELLRSFGVEAMPQLPKEQYGAFATVLRGLGAQI